MIWSKPKIKTNGLTINQARAGYKGFYDRIDLTLNLSKIYRKECRINQKKKCKNQKMD